MLNTRDINNHIEEDGSFSQDVKIKILTSISRLGLIIVSLDHLFTFIFNNYAANHISSLLCYFLFIGVLVFIKKQKYDAAKYFFYFIGLLTIAIHHVIYGPNIGAEMSYLLIVVISAYMFKDRAQLLLVVALAIYIGIEVSYQQSGTGLLYASEQVKMLIFVFVIASLTFFLRKIFEEDDYYNQLRTEQNNELLTNNEQLRRFNYILVNELKVPVNNIIGHSNLLAETPNLSSETEDQYINTIFDDGNKLSNTIASIKNFQELHDSNFKEEEIALCDLIKTCTEELDPLISHHNTIVRSQVAPMIKTYRYPIYVTIKKLIEHIIEHHADDKVNIDFSFEEQKNKALHIYIEGYTVSDNFTLHQEVSKKSYTPFTNVVTSDEVFTKTVIINKMIQRVNGKISQFITPSKHAYLIELPQLCKKS